MHPHLPRKSKKLLQTAAFIQHLALHAHPLMRRHHLGGDDPERWTLKCPVRQLAQAFGRIDLALGHMGTHQTWRNISIHLRRKRCVGEFRTKRGFWDVLGHHVHPQTTRCCSAKSCHLWHHGRTKLPLRHVLLRTVCSPRCGTGHWGERYVVVK